MPPELAARYTLDGRIGVEDWYHDDTRAPGKPKVFTRRRVAANLRKVRRREEVYYGATDTWLYAALERHPVRDLHVVNMGSTNPWYESVALAFGARQVTVIEYNEIVSKHPRIRALTPADFERAPATFDAAFSISSFEHDGLGRYGDPLNPEADLEAMARLRTIVRPGGLLYLAVPVGLDKVVWNAHRIYGALRLPLLTEGFELIEAFGGADADRLGADTGRDAVHQPVLVLRNARSP